MIFHCQIWWLQKKIGHVARSRKRSRPPHPCLGCGVSIKLFWWTFVSNLGGWIYHTHTTPTHTNIYIIYLYVRIYIYIHMWHICVRDHKLIVLFLGSLKWIEDLFPLQYTGTWLLTGHTSCFHPLGAVPADMPESSYGSPLESLLGTCQLQRWELGILIHFQRCSHDQSIQWRLRWWNFNINSKLAAKPVKQPMHFFEENHSKHRSRNCIRTSHPCIPGHPTSIFTWVESYWNLLSSWLWGWMMQ
jgi:hypothetical protein